MNVICRAGINQDVYIRQTRAEEGAGKTRGLLVYGQCSQIGCTRRARPEPIGPLVMNLCTFHIWDLSAWSRSRVRGMVTELEREGLITQHTKGWTYVIRLRNGMVKVGCTAALNNRLQALSREQGGVPVVILAILQGGASREALEHARWQSLRVAGAMEVFHPAAELLQWAEKQGVADDAKGELEKFASWVPKNNGASKWRRLIELMTTNTNMIESEQY